MEVREATASPPVLSELYSSLSRHASAHRLHSGRYLDQEREPGGSLPRAERDTLISHLNDGDGSKQAPFISLLFTLSHFLERLPRSTINMGFKTVASYHFFGLTGIVLASLYTLMLTIPAGLSVWIVLYLQGTAALLTVIYIRLTILITKRDAVVFFNYFITLMAGEWLVLRILGQPVVPYLEVLTIGFGLMLAFSRTGCFMAGCCYGKPSRFGICYAENHTKTRFPAILLNVRLLPIQLIDALWLFIITGISTFIMLSSAEAGTALSTFLILLATGRFFFERYRGDPSRPYYYGFSQAQWTSIGIMLLTIGLEWFGFFPRIAWHSLLLSLFLILMGANRLRSRQSLARCILTPDHIQELARFFDIFKKGNIISAASHAGVQVRTTSCTIQISENKIRTETHLLHHVTMSSKKGKLRKSEAVKLARLIEGWYPHFETSALIADYTNIYHLVQFQVVKE